MSAVPATIPGVIVIVPDPQAHGGTSGGKGAWLVTWRRENVPHAVTVYSTDALLGCVAMALRDHGHEVPPVTITVPGRDRAVAMPPAFTPHDQDARRVTIMCGRRR